MPNHPLTEHPRLVLLAEEYRRRGFQVNIYPPDELRPESLQGFFIGLIAQTDEALIVADVRTRDNLSLGGEFDLKAIAQRAEALPNTTFELIVIVAPKTEPAHGEAL